MKTAYLHNCRPAERIFEADIRRAYKPDNFNPALVTDSVALRSTGKEFHDNNIQYNCVHKQINSAKIRINQYPTIASRLPAPRFPRVSDAY